MYAGIQFGLKQFKALHTYTNPDASAAAESIKNPKAIGIVYGGQLGYMHAIGIRNFFFVEALGLSGASTKITDKLFIDGASANDGEFSARRNFLMGAAIGGGMRLNPVFSGYAKLGYEQSSYGLTYSNLTFGSEKTFAKTKKTGSIVPGAGISYNLTDSFIARLEYNYTLKKTLHIRDAAELIDGAKRGFIFAPSEHRISIQFNYIFI